MLSWVIGSRRMLRPRILLALFVLHLSPFCITSIVLRGKTLIMCNQVNQLTFDLQLCQYQEGASQSINHIQGVLVSESSWESSRLPPTVEKSIVSCATACIDKFRADFSCNAIMFVQETQECHFGNTTLTDENENEATEFVYRIPDGKGKIL